MTALKKPIGEVLLRERDQNNDLSLLVETAGLTQQAYNYPPRHFYEPGELTDWLTEEKFYNPYVAYDSATGILLGHIGLTLPYEHEATRLGGSDWVGTAKLFVHPDYTGNRIGEMLVRKILETTSHPRLYAAFLAQSVASKHIHLKVGFTQHANYSRVDQNGETWNVDILTLVRNANRNIST